jgi:hypothetical protein
MSFMGSSKGEGTFNKYQRLEHRLIKLDNVRTLKSGKKIHKIPQSPSLKQLITSQI